MKLTKEKNKSIPFFYGINQNLYARSSVSAQPPSRVDLSAGRGTYCKYNDAYNQLRHIHTTQS